MHFDVHFDLGTLIALLPFVSAAIHYMRKTSRNIEGYRKEHDATWFDFCKRREIDPATYRPERAKIAGLRP